MIQTLTYSSSAFYCSAHLKEFSLLINNHINQFKVMEATLMSDLLST